MFRKLLKYDMAAVFRVWWLLLVILPVLSITLGFSLLLLSGIPDNSDLAFLDVFAMLGIYLAYFVFVGATILTEVLIFWRFYKHFYTDEGYLTFTLPVKRSTLFLSKTVNAAIWNVLLFALSILSVGLVGILLPTECENSFVASLSMTLRQLFLSSFTQAWEAIGAWTLVYLLLALLLLFLMTLFSITLMHLCITVGSILVNKGKLFLSIGIYYGVNSVISTVLTFTALFTLTPMIIAFDEFAADFSPLRLHASISLMLLIACAIVAGLVGIVYCMTLNKIEQKLNLP